MFVVRSDLVQMAGQRPGRLVRGSPSPSTVCAGPFVLGVGVRRRRCVQCSGNCVHETHPNTKKEHTMTARRVLISGAGIAGPALAHWLAAAGDDVTLVERAPTLREGGQAVDFRGSVHRAVLEQMGLWEAIVERRTRPGDLLLVDRRDRVRATLPAAMMAGDVEIVRGDLCRLLYERTRASTRYRFDDRIVRLDDRGDAVSVGFERGAPEAFDLVVGADGLRSGVRALAFGDGPRVLRHHGYRIASFGMAALSGRESAAVSYCEAGRGLMVSPISP